MLEDSPAFPEPLKREGLVFFDGAEFVPVIITAVKLCAFCAVQNSLCTHPVRWVSENKVYRLYGEFGEFG